MAGTKEIKVRLQSVRNTKKITYAMKLVSAAKLRKAQEAVAKSREYTNALNGVLSNLKGELAGSDFTHPLMEKRSEVKHVCFLIVGGSRGLCGGYNTNLNKKVEALYKEKRAQYPDAELSAVLVGRKPAEYFRRVRKNYTTSHEDLTENPNTWPIEDICKALEKEFLEKKIDEVVLVYTRFKSALSMSVVGETIIPMASEDAAATETTQGGVVSGVTLFEPSPVDVWSAIIPRIMRSRVRQAALDAKASEHGSRMTAMESATKNSGDIIQALQLEYNKLRQGKITAELLDIIGGSEALS